MNEVVQHIENHIPALRRYALVLSRDATDADDLVQNCLLRALSKAHLYKCGTNLRAWLLTILHNLYMSEVRRNAKWKRPANPEGALEKLSVPASQPSAVMLRAVARAMMALPDQQRKILYRIGVDGESYKEVAKQFDLPVGTVKSGCYRARTTLLFILSKGEDSHTASDCWRDNTQ
ncbi:MAG: sigma-70 family RNA polymerase sigma factor [Alphaproteobacteria bacterium]